MNPDSTAPLPTATENALRIELQKLRHEHEIVKFERTDLAAENGRLREQTAALRAQLRQAEDKLTLLRACRPY